MAIGTDLIANARQNGMIAMPNKKVRIMKNSVISFPDFIRECHEDPAKKAWIEEYERKNGVDVDTRLEEHPFYKDYLSKFNPLYPMTIETVDKPIVHVSHDDVPVCRGLSLMFRLIFGSLSSKYKLCLSDAWLANPEPVIRTKLTIMIDGKDKPDFVTTFDELTVSMVQELFKLYMKEQIDNYLEDDPEEISKLHIQQKERLKEYRELSCWPIFDVTEAYKTVLNLYCES
ncbi:MAG: hypothetical protein IJK46_07775 [Prevotella sp.]|nr:hypothetical protein [Prevotella sp.]